MKLYNYFNSSTAYRIRIALNLKGVAHDLEAINLLGAEQSSKEYLTINPQGLVPAIETEQGTLAQSLAILEYLEAQYPQPSILPGNDWEKAQIRSLAYTIACDIHPLNNLRVLKYLKKSLKIDNDARNIWYHHWIEEGFNKVEAQLSQLDRSKNSFCFGHSPTIADICLIPQVVNASRLKVDMKSYPIISEISSRCNEIEAFINSSPEYQPDYKK